MSESTKSGGEVPEFPDSYHRARRMLAFFSALLLSWEYVRVRPRVDSEGVSSPDLPVIGDSFVIEAPQVIPNVMVLLVIYFSYRYAVEWFQSSEVRRKSVASRIDAGVSMLLATAAVVVFVAQRSGFSFQLSGLLTPSRLTGFIMALVVCMGYGFLVISVVVSSWRSTGRADRLRFEVQVVVAFSSLPGLAFAFYQTGPITFWVGIGILAGVAATYTLIFLVRWRKPWADGLLSKQQRVRARDGVDSGEARDG